MNLFLALVVCFLYSLACFSFGAFLLRLLAPEAYGSSVAAAASAFLLGMGILGGCIWQTMATFGLFTRPAVLAVLVIGAAAGVLPSLPLLRALARPVLRSPLWFWRLPLAWKAVVLLLLLFVARALARAVLPPEPLGDAVAFYMALPRVMAESGYLRSIPMYENFVAYTIMTEQHFGALMLFSQGTAAAAMFALPVAVAAAALLVALARRCGLGWRGQLLMVAILCSSTAFNRYVGDGKTDTFAITLALAAFYWALHVQSERDGSALRLVGLFTGLAILAKISYMGILPLGIVLVLVIRHLRRQEPAAALRGQIVPLARILAVIGLCAAAMLAFQVIKNTVIFDRPLAPFGPQILKTNRASTISVAHDELTMRRVYLGYPLFLVYAHAGNADHISMLALAFAPLVLLLPRKFWSADNPLCLLALAGLAGITLWISYQPAVFTPRYFLIDVILLALPVAYAAEVVLTTDDLRRRFGGLVTASVIVVLLIAHTDIFIRTTANIIGDAKGYVRGKLTDCDEELDSTDRTCHAAQIINAQAEPGARIMHLPAQRYWLRSDLIVCSRTNLEWQSIRTNDPAANWEQFFDMGFEYLVVNSANLPDVLSRYLPVDKIPAWLKAEQIYHDGDYFAYRITSTDPARQPSVRCEQTRPNYWQVVPAQKT